MLKPAEELVSSPEFQNADGDLIPDVATYDTWFQRAAPEKRKLAVGARRYATVQQALGTHPEWSAFVDPETGRLLTLVELRGETGFEREARVAKVRDLLTKRGAQKREVARYGFQVAPPMLKQPISKPIVKESWAGGKKMEPIIHDAFEEMPDAAKRIGPIRVIMSPHGGSAYTFGQIYLDPEQRTGDWFKSHFYHEYAHYYADKTGVLKSEAFAKAMAASIERAGDLSAEQLQPKIGTESQAVSHDNAVQLLRALRGEQWGDEPGYMQKGMNQREEVFATAYQNYVHYNPRVFKELPELKQFFDSHFAE